MNLFFKTQLISEWYNEETIALTFCFSFFFFYIYVLFTLVYIYITVQAHLTPQLNTAYKNTRI